MVWAPAFDEFHKDGQAQSTHPAQNIKHCINFRSDKEYERRGWWQKEVTKSIANSSTKSRSQMVSIVCSST